MPFTHDQASTVMHTADPHVYQESVDTSFVPLRITPKRDRHFSASIRAVGAGDVAFTEVRSVPQRVERTPGSIALGGNDFYKVSLMLSGTGLLIQDGRELNMKPGDICFYDTSRPYSLLFGAQFCNLIMMFPKDRLDSPAQFAESLTAVSLAGEHPLAKIVSGFLTQSSPQLHLLPETARSKLAHTSLGLFNSVLAAVLDHDATQRDPHRVLLEKIYSHIRTHLSSPDLSPGSIAAANHISKRHLHALFKETGTTVSAWIKTERLERCRSDLRDPTFSHMGVAALAAKWGFADAAHFSRNFRASYGVSPTELRQVHR